MMVMIARRRSLRCCSVCLEWNVREGRFSEEKGFHQRIQQSWLCNYSFWRKLVKFWRKKKNQILDIKSYLTNESEVL